MLVARQATGSARLRAALRAALAAGNAVNAWTPVGIVPGVRVESLARLREFRVRPRAAAQERGGIRAGPEGRGSLSASM
jgi:hypothetical protein